MGSNGKIFLTFSYKFGQLVQKLNLKKKSEKKRSYMPTFLLGEGGVGK
jgi:hypothetical protein